MTETAFNNEHGRLIYVYFFHPQIKSLIWILMTLIHPPTSAQQLKQRIMYEEDSTL